MFKTTSTEASVPACVVAPSKATHSFKTDLERRSRLRFAIHPVLSDLAVTGISEFSVLVAGLGLVSLFGRLMGPDALGEYLLLRRVTGWLLTAVLLGMGNALPRFIAHSVKRPEAERRAYFLGGSACLVSCTIIVGLVLYLERQWFARWLFGSSQFTYLILPLDLMLMGFAAQTASYGYYRGILAVRRASAIQLFQFAIIPLGAVALLYPTRSVALILDATGGLNVLAALIFAEPICRRIGNNRLPKLRPYVAELLRYGISRVPGDFGVAAFFVLGPLVATHYVSMTKVGYLLLGSNFLMVMGYTAGPLAVIVLSKYSMMLSEDRLEEIRASLKHLVGAVLDLSIFASLQLVVIADVLIRILVGTRFLDALVVTRLLLLAIPPYLFFLALRGSIDAATVKPLNAGNILTALSIYGALTIASLKFLPGNSLLDGIAGSLVVALGLLGMLTARTFRALYGVTIPWRKYAPSIGAAVLLGALTYGFHSMMGLHEVWFITAVFELLISGVFLSILIMLKSPWLNFVWRMVFYDRKTAIISGSESSAV